MAATPFAIIPHPEPAILVRVLEREGLSGAWVGHLPSVFYRDPAPGNDELFALLAPHPTLRPAPCIRPDWPGWERALASAVDRGARAIRAYPPQWGLGADDPSVRSLCGACGEAGVALVFTARFEDLRQRHWMDQAGDLSAAAVRAVARGNRQTRIVVCSAGRGTIEEVHWGLTPAERDLVFWDILVDLGTARGRARVAPSHDRPRAVRLRNCVAVASRADAAREPGAPA